MPFFWITFQIDGSLVPRKFFQSFHGPPCTCNRTRVVQLHVVWASRPKIQIYSNKGTVLCCSEYLRFQVLLGLRLPVYCLASQRSEIKNMDTGMCSLVTCFFIGRPFILVRHNATLFFLLSVGRYSKDQHIMFHTRHTCAASACTQSVDINRIVEFI